jgi:hypothetical protein
LPGIEGFGKTEKVRIASGLVIPKFSSILTAPTLSILRYITYGMN